jgi:hypothetical protein
VASTPEFVMTRVSVVHYTGATAKSRSVVASLVADQRDAGASVELIDISTWTTISQDLPPHFVARVLGHEARHQAFAEVVHSLGATIVAPSSPSASPNQVRAEHRSDVDTAIESELLTYFRADKLPHTRAVTSLRAKLARGVLKTYWALDALWSAAPPDHVFIPNGRTSRQKAARKVAEHYGIPVTLYENGRARPDSYYAGGTQPHDRIASQAEVDQLTKKLSRKAIEALADEWLSLRMAPSGGTNSFSGLWQAGVPAARSDRKTAVFFASSFDEFLAFGPMWTIDSWSHQFEAFDSMMSILERSGVDLVLRLHPNLGTKSRRYFLREVRDIKALAAKHPTLKVYWHNDSVNSYDLVKSADYVIVERSTIGLEANMMGKPVWITQASQWDLIADIRQVLKPGDITEELMKLWSADPYPAQKFAAYWMIQERPLRYSWESWSSWNPDRPPFRMKAAVLAVRNPWRHKLQLLALEWAKWRNSTFTTP